MSSWWVFLIRLQHLDGLAACADRAATAVELQHDTPHVVFVLLESFLDLAGERRLDLAGQCKNHTVGPSNGRLHDETGRWPRNRPFDRVRRIRPGALPRPTDKG